MIQYIAVALCIAAAIAYASWRMHKSLKKTNEPCCGCEGCALKNQCCDKKTCEKFGHVK
jgi:hypothetical protein